ncbi:NF-kappa-B inhibitor-interacting Ras-like protein 2 [Styela clava]|uniref:NF-kappa-B inhibitor-interacting Ras-like protein 2 n=1 Tax=Styela clava TaxID=7725 RepID=UPI0019393C8B|nr:NF-kappa-B inhibitor-interacting Ras-like protein 2 [Styela clava]
MVKTCKLVVCGAPGVGKTTILENAIYGEYASKDIMHTREDCYLAQIETDRGVKEQVRIQDTSGNDWLNPSTSGKHYLHFGEGFVLVYSISDRESFRCIEAIKREIDRTREKKEVVIVVVGNKTDLHKQRQVDAMMVQKWAAKEKVKIYNSTMTNRTSVVEPFTYVCSRLTQPPQKSTLLGSRRLKQTSVD